MDTRKPVLTKNQIKKLVEEANKIKKIFMVDQDIEFAYSNKKFYFLQTRPITSVVKQIESTEKVKGTIIKGQRVSSGTYIGKAIIVNNKFKEKNVNNSVLVMNEFYPEIIYKLHKFGAIVTAKGGKLSHAVFNNVQRISS